MDFQKWVSRLGSEIILEEVNCFQAQPHEDTLLHIHPGQLHIACFERGTGQCIIKDVVRKIRPGMILIVRPGDRHEFIPDSKRPYRACFLHFTWYGELPGDLPEELLVPPEARSTFFRHCRELSESCHRGMELPGGEFFLYSRLLRFFGELQQWKGVEAVSGIPSERKLDKVLDPVLHALFGPPFNYPGIDALAEKVGISRRKLTRIFREHMGCGIKQYFLANVMRYANFMLENGEYGAAQLARQCGYSTTQNFLLAYRNYLKNHPRSVLSPMVMIWKPAAKDGAGK